MRRRGFTLLELCFVIMIIAILAAILFPVFARAREAARRASCASNLSQIGAALNLYAQTYDGRYPKRNNDFRPISDYADGGVMYCPSDSEEHVPDDVWRARPIRGNPPYSSYVYRGGLSNDDRADIAIAGERQNWHGDVNVLHLGGYVKAVPGESYRPPAPVPPKQAPVPPPAAPACRPGRSATAVGR